MMFARLSYDQSSFTAETRVPGLLKFYMLAYFGHILGIYIFFLYNSNFGVS